MNLNKTFLVGNLAADPELRNLPSGRPVCSFRIATNRMWTDRESGEKKEDVQFHSIVAWGKLGTLVSQYLSKGSLVLVEGRLNTRSWEDSEGNRRYRTEIVAENIQFGPRGIGASGQTTEPSPAPQPQPSQENKNNKNKGAKEEEIPTIEEGEDIDVEEIPF